MALSSPPTMVLILVLVLAIGPESADSLSNDDDDDVESRDQKPAEALTTGSPLSNLKCEMRSTVTGFPMVRPRECVSWWVLILLFPAFTSKNDRPDGIDAEEMTRNVRVKKRIKSVRVATTDGFVKGVELVVALLLP